MTILKFKSMVYRYIGIYLADKEENDYLTSDAFWNDYAKIKRKTGSMRSSEIQGLLIGSWQAKHGFSRPMKFWRYRGQGKWYKPFIVFAETVVCNYESLKWDIIHWFKRKFK